MIPDRHAQAEASRGLAEIEAFLSRSSVNLTWVAADQNRHRDRVNPYDLTATRGPLCWLCGANVIGPRLPRRRHTACKYCCANDAGAARALGLDRVLPVWFRPADDMRGTAAALGQDDLTEVQDRLAGWFHDPAPARAWAHWLIPLLATRGNVTQTIDLSLPMWQKAVGSTRHDSAVRYAVLLDSQFPELLDIDPSLGDPDWLAAQRRTARS